MKAMNQIALLEWYQHHHRSLLFRQDRNPYKIWISEIMAQQTRIEAMLGHYGRFIERYPDVKALAGADEDELMKLWQGLGYYSRARNLKKAAMVCQEKYGGLLPTTKAELVKLPGIGDYTAGAIASIAWGERVSAIDGNVIRVYARYLGLEDDFSKPAARRQLEALVQADLPVEKDMPAWTQALMELGALVCTPKKVDCAHCPLALDCQALAQSRQLELPFKAPKAARRQEEKKIIVQAGRKGGQWAIKLRKRPARGLLAGLYEFDDVIEAEVEDQYDLGEAIHIFTHRQWNMHGELVITRAEEGFWTLEEIEAMAALPSAIMPFYKRALGVLEKLENEDGKTDTHGAV